MHSEPGIRNIAVVRRWVIAVITIGVAAAVWLAQAAHRRPNPPDPYLSALDAYVTGDLAGLETQIAELRALQGPPPRIQLLEGMRELRTGRWADAVLELQAASADPDVRPTAMALLGEAYYRLGKLPDAVSALQTALSLDSRQTIARRWLAAAYYDLGANDLALEQLERISEQDTEDPRPFRLRGLIYKDFEQYQAAIDAYRAAMERSPDDVLRQEILHELAACHLALLRYEDVWELLKDAPDTADTLALRAKCDHALGRVEPAQKGTARALALDPHHFDALMLSGQLALEAGNAASGAARFQEAIRLHPGEFEARYQLAGAYRRLGRDADAELQIAEMNRLQALRKEFTNLHYQAFRETQDADLRYRLGVMARELHKPQLAAAWFGAALALNPNHREAGVALSELQDLRETQPRHQGNHIIRE